MIRDFATFDADQPLACDICIAGAGAAGISIALEFAGHGERVILLESGGHDYEDLTQALYAGQNLGRPYFDLDIPRVRFFGGSTNHWGGMCAPLDPLDFEKRDWVPHSGWPIAAPDLAPYYARAHPLLGLGPFNYRPAEIAPPGIDFLAFQPDRICPKMWRYSVPAINFGVAYRELLAKASNVDVLLHANLVDIETDPAASRVSAYGSSPSRARSRGSRPAATFWRSAGSRTRACCSALTAWSPEDSVISATWLVASSWTISKSSAGRCCRSKTAGMRLTPN